MSSQRLEAILARLYTDRDFRERFLAGALAAAELEGLDDGERRAIEGIDRVGLRMMVESLAAKRRDRSHQ